MSKSIELVIELTIRLLTIAAILWFGHLLISNITDTYHDTRVICVQVTRHSPDCR